MVDPAADANLRAALRPFRADPDRFAANVRVRLVAVEANDSSDPLADASPFVRAAAALIPLPVVTGGKVALLGKGLAVVPGGWKIVSYLVLPAVSLIVLVVACLGGVIGVRGVVKRPGPTLVDPAAITEATATWYKQHQMSFWTVFFLAMAVVYFGGTGLVFLLLIGSFGILLVVLRSLARLGLGNRTSVGQACMMGLMFLGQMMMGGRFGSGDIHFVDPAVVGVVLLGGAVLAFPFSLQRPIAGRLRWPQKVVIGLALPAFLVLILGLSAWQLEPTLRPITPDRLRRHVEAFDKAPFSTASWGAWAVEAEWAIDAGLPLDLSRPRHLLATSGNDATNPYVLSAAARAGLIPAAYFARLPDFESSLHSLVDDPQGIQATFAITSLAQEEWVIRGAALSGRLTAAERDLLQKRLNLTLDRLSDRTAVVLVEARLITRLLAVIDRPVDRDHYRPLVHRLLGDYQSRSTGGFQSAGGFKGHRTIDTGDIQATEAAVDLMATFGVPPDVDLNWVRSFVRPAWNGFSDAWIAAVTRFRLDRLPDAPPPTWWAILNAERTLIAAFALVGVCLYAILSSPRPVTLQASADPPDPPG